MVLLRTPSPTRESSLPPACIRSGMVTPASSAAAEGRETASSRKAERAGTAKRFTATPPVGDGRFLSPRSGFYPIFPSGGGKPVGAEGRRPAGAGAAVPAGPDPGPFPTATIPLPCPPRGVRPLAPAASPSRAPPLRRGEATASGNLRIARVTGN